MTEEDNDIIWGDEEPEGEGSGDSGNFVFDEPGGDIWEDLEGGVHELHYGDPEVEDAEYRVGFDTFDEARDYINEILTGADQYFDIYYDLEDALFEVYYMGDSK